MIQSPTQRYISSAEMITGYGAIRRRLMNPPNALKQSRPAVVLKIVERAPEAAVRRYDPPTKAMIAGEPKAHVAAWVDWMAESSKGVDPEVYVKARCRQLRVRWTEMCGPSREDTLIAVRHPLMYEVFLHFPMMNYTKIGILFCRDPATTRHAIHKKRLENGGDVSGLGRKQFQDNAEFVAGIKAQYFAGIGPKAIAAALGISPSTVHRMAKRGAWKANLIGVAE